MIEISSFYTSVPKIMIICCTFFEIWHMTNVIVFHFGQFFPFLTPPPSPPSSITVQKNKISKKWKKLFEKSSFCTCVPKIMIRWCTVSGIWWATDGRMEKWHKEAGAPPKNFITLKYQFMIYYKNFITLTLFDIGPKAFSERR